MGSITITDECLSPGKYVYLRYSGADPWGVSKKIWDLLKPFFHVTSSKVNQTRINWDITSDPISFFTNFWVKKPLSNHTMMWTYIVVQGTKSKAANTGEFYVRINAELKTKFSGWGIFLKPAWYLYSYLFYNRVRRTFLDRCRTMINNFRNELKDHYNLTPTEIQTAAGAFG